MKKYIVNLVTVAVVVQALNGSWTWADQPIKGRTRVSKMRQAERVSPAPITLQDEIKIRVSLGDLAPGKKNEVIALMSDLPSDQRDFYNEHLVQASNDAKRFNRILATMKQIAQAHESKRSPSLGAVSKASLPTPALSTEQELRLFGDGKSKNYFERNGILAGLPDSSREEVRTLLSQIPESKREDFIKVLKPISSDLLAASMAPGSAPSRLAKLSAVIESMRESIAPSQPTLSPELANKLFVGNSSDTPFSGSLSGLRELEPQLRELLPRLPEAERTQMIRELENLSATRIGAAMISSPASADDSLNQARALTQQMQKTVESQTPTLLSVGESAVAAASAQP